MIACLLLIVTRSVSTELSERALSTEEAAISPVAYSELLIRPSQLDSIDSRDPRLTTKGGIVYLDSVPYTGTTLDFAPTGAVVRSTPYADGRVNGLDESWYDDGTLKSQRWYANGYREGVHKSWWESGRVKFVYEFEHDLHNGLALDWFRDGTLFKAFNYKNGQESGQQSMFFEDGSLRANYVVKNGRRFGLIGSKPCAAETDEATS
jgi:antitoxin component YwqK of YwqJK toxin-antitoxin module